LVLNRFRQFKYEKVAAMRMCSIVLMVLLVMPVWARDLPGSQLQQFIDSLENVNLPKKFKYSIVNWLKNLSENKDLILSPTRSISGVFRIRLQREEHAKLKKGKRTIRLVWYGGQPQVKIWRWPPQKTTNIKKADAKQLPHSRPTPVFEAIIPVRNKAIILENLQLLELGFYSIKIHDAKYGKTQYYWFSVVDELPPIINAIQTSNFSEIAKHTVLAIWLAAQGKGEWEFEAYQLVTDKKTQEYYPAFLVKIGLEAGICPRINQ